MSVPDARHTIRVAADWHAVDGLACLPIHHVRDRAWESEEWDLVEAIDTLGYDRAGRIYNRAWAEAREVLS